MFFFFAFYMPFALVQHCIFDARLAQLEERQISNLVVVG